MAAPVFTGANLATISKPELAVNWLSEGSRFDPENGVFSRYQGVLYRQRLPEDRIPHIKEATRPACLRNFTDLILRRLALAFRRGRGWLPQAAPQKAKLAIC